MRKGVAINLQSHLDRLSDGMEILGLQPIGVGMDALQWRQLVVTVVGKLLKDQPIQDDFGRIRLTVYRRGGGRYLPEEDSPELLAEIHPIASDPWALRPPLHCGIAHSYPIVHSLLSGAKSLSALPYVMASRYAAAQGFDDAILRNARGEVAECTASNIFLVLQNRIVTPWLGSGCLPGVMRAKVMQLAQDLGMLVQMQPIQISRLSEAKEIFITNAIQGLQPVGSIAETTYAAKHHPVMSTIRDSLFASVG